MNNTVRIALAVAYAAVGIWALMPTPPKPLAAATSPPPTWERPRYQRPAPPPRIDEDTIAPDRFSGSNADDNAVPKPAVHHVEMDEADHWAIANLKFKELPPLEFDHPYRGSLRVVDVDSEYELRRVCGFEELYHHATVVGCSNPTPPKYDVCTIYLGPRPAWT